MNIDHVTRLRDYIIKLPLFDKSFMRGRSHRTPFSNILARRTSIGERRSTIGRYSIGRTRRSTCVKLIEIIESIYADDTRLK